jgi:hypothetical protein
MRTLLILTTICCIESCPVSASANPGPCTEQIAQLERIMLQSTALPSAQQTVGSQLHRQPTPQTVESANSKAKAELNELLGQAKTQDGQDNASACMNTVSRIKAILSQ